MEHASAEEKERLRMELQTINPAGTIISEHYSRFDKTQWLSLLGHSFNGEKLYEEPEEIQNLPDTFSIKGVSVQSPERLLLLLEALIRGEFGNIFRAKGQIRAGNQKLRFDVADGLYSITGGETEAEEKVVFIGTQIARQKMRCYFEGLPEKIVVSRKNTNKMRVFVPSI